MSNQAIVEVRKTNEDVLVLAEDNYGKTFTVFELDEFYERFPTVESLLEEVSCWDEMDGSFYIEGDRVILDCCSSLEVSGFNDEVHTYLRSEQECSNVMIARVL